MTLGPLLSITIESAMIAMIGSVNTSKIAVAEISNNLFMKPRSQPCRYPSP